MTLMNWATFMCYKVMFTIRSKSVSRAPSPAAPSRPQGAGGGALYPDGAALSYDTWTRYVTALHDKYRRVDGEWQRAKSMLGIDEAEPLVKAAGAVDHSDVLPALGRLYLSERYLVFMAAVGRNHYVVRLGTVAAVGARSIPFLMRDCLTVTVDPESVAVLSGHVPTHHEEPAAVSAAAAAASAAAAGVEARGSSVPRGRGGGGGANGGGGGSVHAGGAIAAALRSREAAKAAAAAHAAAVERASLGNHVSSLVASFANAGKPLVFSLLELRETKRRDHWRALLVEMASAHRLHAALGYGSAGRLTRCGGRPAGGLGGCWFFPIPQRGLWGWPPVTVVSAAAAASPVSALAMAAAAAAAAR